MPPKSGKQLQLSQVVSTHAIVVHAQQQEDSAECNHVGDNEVFQTEGSKHRSGHDATTTIFVQGVAVLSQFERTEQVVDHKPQRQAQLHSQHRVAAVQLDADKQAEQYGDDCNCSFEETSNEVHDYLPKKTIRRIG